MYKNQVLLALSLQLKEGVPQKERLKSQVYVMSSCHTDICPLAN